MVPVGNNGGNFRNSPPLAPPSKKTLPDKCLYVKIPGRRIGENSAKTSKRATSSRFVFPDPEQNYPRGRVCCSVQPKRAADGGIHIEFPVFAWQKHLTDYWLVARPASRWYSGSSVYTRNNENSRKYPGELPSR